MVSKILCYLNPVKVWTAVRLRDGEVSEQIGNKRPHSQVVRAQERWCPSQRLSRKEETPERKWPGGLQKKLTGRAGGNKSSRNSEKKIILVN